VSFSNWGKGMDWRGSAENLFNVWVSTCDFGALFGPSDEHAIDEKVCELWPGVAAPSAPWLIHPYYCYIIIIIIIIIII